MMMYSRQYLRGKATGEPTPSSRRRVDGVKSTLRLYFDLRLILTTIVSVLSL